MRKRTCIIGVLFALVFLVGCASMSPAQVEAAREAREGALELVERFAAALREGTPAEMHSLLASSVSPSPAMHLTVQFQQASWLPGYSAYQPSAEEVGAGMDAEDLLTGRVELKLPAPRYHGEETTEAPVLELVKEPEGWAVANFRLDQPEEGDRVDPPAEVRAALRRQTEPIMRALREGRIGDVYYALPDKRECHYRLPEVSFLEGLFGGPGPMSIYTDLEIFKELRFINWPASGQPLEVVYLSPGVVAVAYQIPYIWHGAPAEEPEMLDLKLIFNKHGGKWVFQRMRMSGKAIPYS